MTTRTLRVASLLIPLLASFRTIDAAQRAVADDKQRLPNFVLCMADDQGWGDIGHRNQDLQTPILDELAATTLRLDRFYAAAPVCSPTRGSVMTGRHPNRFGCFSWGHTLRPEEITIAEALKTAGYATGHFGKWHLGPVTAESSVNPGNSGFDEWLSAPNFYENDSLMSHRGTIVQKHGESSMIAADAAIDFMRNAVDHDTPFLAVVWFGSPHSPHIATDELRAIYKDHPRKLKDFYGEITGIDRAVGKLRTQLESMGVRNNTLLWYTSDNGALSIGSAGGLTGNKSDLEEGGIRVPCMLEWPDRIGAARVSNMPAGTVDIYPTLLDLARVTMPHQPLIDGVSLVPLIDGVATERSKPMGFWVHPTRGIRTPSNEILAELMQQQQGRSTGDTPQFEFNEPGPITAESAEDNFPGFAAWIDGNWKLHRGLTKNGEPRHRLYDLADDPAEQHNLAAAQVDQVQRLDGQLTTWLKSVTHSLNGHDYKSGQ